MVLLKHWHILFTLLISWNPPIVSSVEVCNCPDFRLSLSVESDTTEKLYRGFLYVATKDSDVELKCDLDNADHGAVQSVEYKFHKTWDLTDNQPIFLSDNQKYELCSDSPGATSTCTLESVQYTENNHMEINIEKGANHIYQCSVTISLKDGGQVILWSHTIKLDVYYPPVKGTVAATDTKTISEGKSMEKFECALPESNPKTKAQWSFRKQASDAWEVIDIPNDSRGQRLTIVEEKIEAGVTEGRGTLMLMIFTPTEDVGFYKCEGVYDTEFPDPADVFEIAIYELRETGHEDSGALQLKPISAITYPKLVNQSSAVNFTVYARDTPGRGDYGDVTYTWQMDNTNIDFDASPHLVLSNNDRTLTVNKLSDYVTNAFSCQMERTVTGDNPQTATSATMGFKNSDVVIAPKYLSIPLTSKSCVEPGSILEAAPNKAYMMKNAALAGDNPEQILLKADTFKYFINKKQLSFISDVPDLYDNDTNVGISESNFNSRLPDRINDRCIYFQYMRAWGGQYQVVEVMKIHRPMISNGCDPPNEDQIEDIKQSFNDATIAKDGSQVKITFPAAPILTTTQPLKMDLLDSSNATLQTKNVSPDTADSCSSWTPLPVVFTGIPTKKMIGLNLKIYFEGSPDVSIPVKDVDAKKCSKPQNVLNLASITPDSVEIEIGEKFTITCTQNFVPNKAELLCQDDGTLSSDAECVFGTCPSPDLADNVESVTPDSTIKAGEKFTVKCKPDFVPQHIELTCTTDGVVSSLDHTVECIKGTCSKPELADNVESITPDSSINAGEKFTVNCASNFVPEFVELMCMADGTVSSLGRSPKCIEKEKCSKPQNVLNLASITPDSAEIEIGEKFTITCTQNFVPNKAELLCQDDGRLSPAAECVAGTCPKPDLADNVDSLTPDSTIKAGEKFTVKCKAGFDPEQPELSCSSNGTVSGLDYIPKCIEKGETSPSTSKFGR